MTTSRVVRLVTPLSLRDVALRLDRGAQAHEKIDPRTGFPFSYKLDRILDNRVDTGTQELLDGRVDVTISPGEDRPVGRGESALLGVVPSFDVRVAYELLWIHRELVAGLLAELVIELALAPEFEHGLISSTQITTLASWVFDEGLTVYEPAGPLFDSGPESFHELAIENYLHFEPRLSTAAEAAGISVVHKTIDNEQL